MAEREDDAQQRDEAAEGGRHRDPGAPEAPVGPPAEAPDTPRPEQGPGPRGNPDVDEERLRRDAEDLDRTVGH